MLNFFRSASLTVRLTPSDVQKTLRQESCLLLIPTASWETAEKRDSLSIIKGRPFDVDIPQSCKLLVQGQLPLEVTIQLKPGYYLPILADAHGPDEWRKVYLAERPFELRARTTAVIELTCAPHFDPRS